MPGFTKVRKGYSPDEVDIYLKRQKLEQDNLIAEQRERNFELKQKLIECEKQLLESREKEEMISRALISAVQKSEEMETVARKKQEMEAEQLRVFHRKWTEFYKKLRLSVEEGSRKSYDRFNAEMDAALDDENARGAVARARGTVDKFEDVFKSEQARVKARPAASSQNANQGGLGVNMEAIARVLNDAPPDERTEKAIKDMWSAGAQKKEYMPMRNIERYFDAEAVRRGSYITEIPPTLDSGFSFEEALNPTDSLEDIMKDLGITEEK